MKTNELKLCRKKNWIVLCDHCAMSIIITYKLIHLDMIKNKLELCTIVTGSLLNIIPVLDELLLLGIHIKLKT